MPITELHSPPERQNPREKTANNRQPQKHKRILELCEKPKGIIDIVRKVRRNEFLLEDEQQTLDNQFLFDNHDYADSANQS